MAVHDMIFAGTVPRTHSSGMISWFPFYFPIKVSHEVVGSKYVRNLSIASLIPRPGVCGLGMRLNSRCSSEEAGQSVTFTIQERLTERRIG